MTVEIQKVSCRLASQSWCVDSEIHTRVKFIWLVLYQVNDPEAVVHRHMNGSEQFHGQHKATAKFLSGGPA